MRFLGIDPGLRITGYGCVEGFGPAARLVEAGAIRLTSAKSATLESRAQVKAVATDGGLAALRAERQRLRADAASVSARLAELEQDVAGLLERLRPEVCAVEALFSHYKHPATAIVMGHARGVILLCVRRAGVRLVELRPKEVKKSMCGSGQADKGQMQRAVQARFGLADPPNPPDVADALAIALCAAGRG